MYGDKDYRDLKHLKIEIDMLKNKLWRKIQTEKSENVKKALREVFEELRRF